MLTFLSKPVRNCDGISRRTFLKAGALGVANLTLADLLRAEHSAGRGSSTKAIINIHLDGGPPQMDMIDPKPGAPIEFRGNLSSIRTRIPGFHVSELMPKVASMADKFIFIRSLIGAEEQHHAFQCLSGFEEKDLASIGGHPSMGCVLAKILGSPKDATPTFVDLMQGRALVRNSARPGFLGPAYKPFRPDISHLFHRELEPGMKKELAARGANHTLSLALSEGITVGRLENRVDLLSNMDRLKREIDRSGEMGAMDKFTQQAMGILTSGKFAEAMDLAKEDPRVVARYTPRVSRPSDAWYTSEGPEAAQKLLLARRLVEAGVRCVSLSISDFDTHSKNLQRMQDLVPIVDHALHALITDLEDRGMLQDVTIVAWGEFGRTPKINNGGGRDHWPRVGMAMMAGGGMRAGQVIGSTDRYAAEATSRPVHYQDVIATLYHNLGIDPLATTVNDRTGRPQFLVNIGQPIREAI
ncbi:MAG: DUF1501 domain-containing protein [Verrucomicrobia bacterium]|nr:DUF1501 domain-containing protein [Verrucomicrobiota bacterium]